jgi:hypothetical protein
MTFLAMTLRAMTFWVRRAVSFARLTKTQPPAPVFRACHRPEATTHEGLVQREEHGVRDRSREPEQPRVEPEIIPPDRSRPFHHAERGEPRVFIRSRRFQHLYVAKPSPFAVIVALLALGVGAVALVVFLLGAVLLALPLAGALAIAFIVLGLARGPARRLR